MLKLFILGSTTELQDYDFSPLWEEMDYFCSYNSLMDTTETPGGINTHPIKKDGL